MVPLPQWGRSLERGRIGRHHRTAQARPPHGGHRERLRERARKAGSRPCRLRTASNLHLFRSIPLRDVKPLAKALLARSALGWRTGGDDRGTAHHPGIGESVALD